MKDMRKLAAALRDFVDHPDYSKGRWTVHAFGWVRVCANKTTAIAWAKYLKRYYSFDESNISISRADNLPGFPRDH